MIMDKFKVNDKDLDAALAYLNKIDEGLKEAYLKLNEVYEDDNNGLDYKTELELADIRNNALALSNLYQSRLYEIKQAINEKQDALKEYSKTKKGAL